MSDTKEENEVAFIDAKYICNVEWDLDDYKDKLAEAGVDGITMDDIEEVVIKYGECTIHLKNGKEIHLGSGRFGEPDYKWPEEVKLFDDHWIELKDEG